jgi:hypothetical protein
VSAVKKGRDPLLPRLRVVEEKDRRKNDTIPDGWVGSNELTCPTAGCQWIAGRLGLSVKDAGDCREHLGRHVSSLSEPRQGQKKRAYAPFGIM